MRRFRNARRTIAAVFALALAPSLLIAPEAATAATPAVAGVPGTWATTGQMSGVRGFAPAVALTDGTVITAGGTDGLTFSSAAERWSAGAWSAAGSIGQAAAGQIAALLPGGKALFAGGSDDTGYYGFGDLFDPTTGTWAQTGPMAHNHAYAASASLTSGDVLVIGGYDGGNTLTTTAVDIYSAAGGTWSAGAALPGVGRYAMTATTLADGRVLVAGGNDGTSGSASVLSAASIYTAGSGWAATGSMRVARFDAAAALLPGGKVLVAGGSDSAGRPLTSSEVFDPATGAWSSVGIMQYARSGLTLTPLADGRVLAVGGYTSSAAPAQRIAEVFDPTTGGWSITGSLRVGRRYNSAVRLTDGTVMALGGQGEDGGAYLKSAEIYTPTTKGTYPTGTFHALTPVRVLDTRVGSGLVGPFYAFQPRSVAIAGQFTVPANAIGVTGIVTVASPAIGGYVTVGPTVPTIPSSSTLNFPAMDNRANNVTVALDAAGKLAMVYVPAGPTGNVHLIFDVTGYFTADATGGTFKPIATPMRLLDTRVGIGGHRRMTSGVPATFPVSIPAGLPADTVAVTGNLTLVSPSANGFAFVGPVIPANATKLTTSTVNSPKGDIRANGVTVAINAGSLSVAWVGSPGSTADLLFDITGYFVSSSGGSRFYPMDPIRIADTRYNLPVQGPVARNAVTTFGMAGRGGVPLSAVGVTGNLTVVGQACAGNLAISPRPAGPGATSTLNFPKGDIRANGFDVSLWSDGSVGVVYSAPVGCSGQFVVDLTGYFAP